MAENTKCWEFTKCGRDRTGGCPAYPRAGRVCYLVAGTMCAGKVQGIYAMKIGQCRECEFYRMLMYEKALEEMNKS